ncbi:MAG: phosphoribosylformylglycinamidine synthase [Cytophagales bacterium]
MILFFSKPEGTVYAVDSKKSLQTNDIEKLKWLFEAQYLDTNEVQGVYIGPRKEMLTPWSTNAVEITQNMGLEGILRIEEFYPESLVAKIDPMLQVKYPSLGQDIFTINIQPESVIYIDDIKTYNEKEGLALSVEEVAYLEEVSVSIGRKLTDSEVFGFSQVNSEHCRHKIFNGIFEIDGVEKPSSLFKLIKKTTEANPNRVVSAYKDNVAFVEGPKAKQFAPTKGDEPSLFEEKDYESVLSLKAETHNFPTTVEPFNGAATGSGGEIRDRLAGGTGSLPLAGTAVYMTSYSRLESDRSWELPLAARKWLYQTPSDILIKASNGASDFGNKFGQPLIVGSVYTFEYCENNKKFGFDKVIMLAGGVGIGKKQYAQKGHAEKGDKIVVMGGDNYRIGMGGSAVSSVATGEFSNSIELNAVQRSNPEMQKRVANAIRALVESDNNPIVSIHDHGAGGHLNCLSELVETTGGKIDLNALPVGDPTLSSKEIVGNESQERMGILMKENDIKNLKNIAERERAPMYVVGETTGDMKFTFEDTKTGQNPIDIKLENLFGKPPRTVIKDKSAANVFKTVQADDSKIEDILVQVLQLESVACKDWLTNKVDRSVTGRVALQQTTGELQLPLNNMGIMATDYTGTKGMATSIGHAAAVALIDEKAGSRMAITESLTNLVFTPLEQGIKGISLSANWMWPCKNAGEDARLYNAVEACSDFALGLGLNIPTGKDSLSMTQKYGKEDVVYAPGTVIISAIGEAKNIRQTIKPDLKKVAGSQIVYIPFSTEKPVLGGSVYAQVVNQLGATTPQVADANYVKNAFALIQDAVENKLAIAGHDIGSGGLITTLLEMCFPSNGVGLNIDLSDLTTDSLSHILFSELPAVVLQTSDANALVTKAKTLGVNIFVIGEYVTNKQVNIQYKAQKHTFDVKAMRDVWFKTSYLLDVQQSGEVQATSRKEHLGLQPIQYKFNSNFSGKLSQYNIPTDRSKAPIAAIIREKGSNGDREMAYSLYLAGFQVRDVHMTDLMTGRETLEDVNFIVFVGGFSNSDVLGSAKGWAGAFKYNDQAMNSLKKFFARPDTLSLGVCNGCQLMVELGLIYPEHDVKPKMLHNNSHKFESIFLTLNVENNNSILMKSLAGSRLGLWVAHGEGKFDLPKAESEYNIVLKYSYEAYPANPNGSAYNTAGIVSKDGRHLAMMPHLERAIFPWQCGHYPEDKLQDEVTPWIEAFVNAREWVEKTR